MSATQLARKYGVPVRAGGMLNGSKIADAQAAYESIATMIPTLMAGTNFVLHSAGWLEAGLAAGYGKFMLDADQIAMLQSFADGVDLSEESRAHGGDPRSRARAATISAAPTPSATSRPRSIRSQIADNNSYEQWEAEGAKDANQRATEAAQRLLAQYEPPPLDPGHRRGAAGLHRAAEGGAAERGDLTVNPPPRSSSNARLRRCRGASWRSSRRPCPRHTGPRAAPG